MRAELLPTPVKASSPIVTSEVPFDYACPWTVGYIPPPLESEYSMNKYFSARIWDEDPPGKRRPDTDPKARTIDSVKVSNARVIDAPHAKHRGANFGGTFALAESVTLPLPKDGWHAVEVYCLWYGRRLKSRGPIFQIDMSKARVRENVTGEVVFDLGR